MTQSMIEDGQRPRVSLVATVLNEAASLPGLLASIEAQTLQPDEIVVVDGGSTDGTYDLLLRWAEGEASRRVICAPCANISVGRNTAIRAATGDIIAVTDGGVVLRPTWLATLVEVFRGDPETDVAAGFFVPDSHGLFERALAATTLPDVRDLVPAMFLPSSRSVAFRKSAWAAVGGYPEWLDYCEDVVFDLELRRAGFRFHWSPEALVAFRPRPTLRAFFRQYYRYARGDGKADLWPRRHAIRYAAYLVGLPMLWMARRTPLALAAGFLAAMLYVHRPIERFIGHRSATPEPHLSVAALAAGIALIPVIRLVGDVAKMLGYPVGVAWRLANRGLQSKLPRKSSMLGVPPLHNPPPRGGEGAGRLSAREREGAERLASPSGRGRQAAKRAPTGEDVAPDPALSRANNGAILAPATCRLSVVVVSYNTRDRLRACLASVQRSCVSGEVETFVVDNASTDGSADMVAVEFPQVRLIRSQKNGGFAYANNIALRKAGGELLLLLNPDTELQEKDLETMIAYAERHPDAGAVGPKLVRADGSLDAACRRSFPTPSVAFYRLSGLARVFPRSERFGRYNLSHLDPDLEGDVDAISGAFMLVRREAVASVGLLDERFFMYGEDLDWASRMKGAGWRIRYNPLVAVLHHKGESSRQTSYRTTLAFYRAMRLFYEKHYQATTMAPVDGLIRGAITARLCWSLVKNALRPRHLRRVST